MHVIWNISQCEIFIATSAELSEHANLLDVFVILYHYKFQMPRQFGSFIVIAVLNLKVCTFSVFILLFYIFYKKYVNYNRLLKVSH
jgi:hypothetical protein